MAKKDPTKESTFQKVVGVFLNTKPMPHKKKVGGKRKSSKKKVK